MAGYVTLNGKTYRLVEGYVQPDPDGPVMRISKGYAQGGLIYQRETGQEITAIAHVMQPTGAIAYVATELAVSGEFGQGPDDRWYYVCTGAADLSAKLKLWDSASYANNPNTLLAITDSKGVTHSITANQLISTHVVDCTQFMRGYASFNQFINNLDMSNVEVVDDGLENCSAFDQRTDGWYMPKLTSTYGMYYACVSLNSPVFQVHAGITNTEWMLGECYVFEKGISGFDMRNVDIATGMLAFMYELNEDLSEWCVPLIHPEWGNANNIDFQTFAWTLPKPVWGTCPGG